MNTFYKLKLSRITIREMWWGTKSPLILLGFPLKLLPVCINSNADDPAVEHLTPFLVPYTELPQNVYAEMYPLLQELATCGFYWPIFHAVTGFSDTTKIYMATLCHAHGKACARIHMRVFGGANKTNERIFVTMFSEFMDGSFVVTSSGKPDLEAPKSQQVRRIVDAGVAQLWSAHSDAIAAASVRQPLVLAANQDEVGAMNERYHAQLRDYHIARGVFVPMKSEERTQAQMVIQSAKSLTEAGFAHGEVLAEIEQLQNKKVSPANVITVLLVSVLLFVAAGAKQWNLKTLWLLLPVLFIHEMGHYFAMLVFRYRNLRMFFIPFLGAAVTGQNYNVPGWKKAIVSLMGPVPGIILGCVVGVIGMIAHQPILLSTAIMLLIINGMNLLPVLPLDGGWVLHTVLFSRHPLLDTAFRVLALGGLVVLALFGQTRVLIYIAIPMMLGLPLAYKLARITADLRAKGVGATSPDAHTLPPETAQAIVHEVKHEFPKVNTKQVAQYTLNIFETLNARPPGAVASLALLAAHGGSLIVALVFGVMFVVAQQGDFGKFLRAAAIQPEHRVSCSDMKSSGGPEALLTASSRNTIVATFPARAKAEMSFAMAERGLPKAASVRLFGDSLMLTLPSADDASRKKWFNELSDQTTNTFVDSTNLHMGVTLMCLAPDAAAAKVIEEEISEYFQGNHAMHLIPPWQPGDIRSTTERAQHNKARQTYAKLQKTSYDFYKDPAWRNSQARLVRAQRQGDLAEAKTIQEQQRDLMQRVIAKQRDRLRSEGPDKVDVKLIDLFATLPQPTVTNYETYRKALAGLAPRLGQLACDRADNADRFAAHSGTVSKASLLLTFHWLTFDQLGDGLPAMVEWLCAKGCGDFKYDFNQGLGGLDTSDLAEE